MLVINYFHNTNHILVIKPLDGGVRLSIPIRLKQVALQYGLEN
jgi:hypothetical protein